MTITTTTGVDYHGDKEIIVHRDGKYAGKITKVSREHIAQSGAASVSRPWVLVTTRGHSIAFTSMKAALRLLSH